MNVAGEIIEAALAGNPQAFQGVLFCGLLGSFVEGEYVEGYSDVDVLIITDHDGPTYGPLPGAFLLKSRLQRHYPVVSVLVHTLFELRTYVGAPYLINYSLAHQVFAREGWDIASTLSGYLASRGFTAENRRRYHLYMVRHDRFNIFRSFMEAPDMRALWKISSQIFDQLRWMAQFHGYHFQSKAQTVEALAENGTLSTEAARFLRDHLLRRPEMFGVGNVLDEAACKKEYEALKSILVEMLNDFLKANDAMGSIPEERISL